MKYPSLETALINFIEFNRKLFNLISTWSLILILYEIIPERKSLAISTNQRFIYRFLAVMVTHFEQNLMLGKLFKITAFLKHLYF